ncbi:hypothetical protein ACFV1L_21190 [Kitasatospora sp. NPDC059646]|uniref:hypothetical protein n=1 Tax=Kitasatospora sp. NPDC059646 TaxID=3346893 RepID=UPI0036890551
MLTFQIVVFVLLALIALCVFVAVLHPDEKRGARAVKVLAMLLPFLNRASRFLPPQ